jgi:hypothetical protein
LQLKDFIFFSKVIVCLLLTTGIHDAFGQFEVHPAPRQRFSSKQQSTARVKEDTPLILPFWDDFSTPSGDFPDTLRWENSRSVWVNNTMAINQPTINVATFEGLDSLGLPYDATNVQVMGYTDKLTSKPIDLGDPTIDQSSVYLSFFYQWQGNGEAPDPSDYLELQFKDNTGTWKNVISIYTKTTFEADVFYDTAVRISDASFFHNDFQFRFRAFGRQSGPFDTWNVDYVYLNDGRQANDHSYPERAAASEISTPFGKYTALPYWHFDPANNADSVVSFEAKNLSNLLRADGTVYDIVVTYDLFGTFTNHLEDGTTSVVSDVLVAGRGINNGINGDMRPFERIEVLSQNIFANYASKNYFQANADSVDVTLKVRINSGDLTDKQKDKLAPLDLTVNDTVSTTFHLRDYYAYDDGIAEYTAGLIQAGSILAYKFEELYGGDEPDTLIGFDVYLPSYAATKNQTVNFYVFADRDQDGAPDSVLRTIPRSIERKGINEFQKIRFTPAVLVSHNFFVGWQQPAAGKVSVGLDADNDTGDQMFVTSSLRHWTVDNDADYWSQNLTLTGSLMIRAVFGPGDLDETVSVGEPLTFGIYPNPTSGSFFIDERFDNIRILNASGIEIAFTSEKVDTKTKVTVNQPPGLYIVQLAKNNRLFTHKLLLGW